MPPAKNSPYRLFLEGQDDFHTILHLLARHGYDWDDEGINRPFIESLDGIAKLMEALPVILKSSYRRIGIVIDANSVLANRWAQLRSRAGSAGVELPGLPQPEGTIVAGLGAASRVGFWLMPDNTSPGDLESFLEKLVPSGDACWSYANEAVIEARLRGAKCQEKDHRKSALHTWLAWQEEPGLPFGTALRAQIFGHDSQDAQNFVDWFHRLFGPP